MSMSKVFKIIKKFYLDTRHFSVRLAIFHFEETLTRYTPYKMPIKNRLKKDEIVLNYLKKNYFVDNIPIKQNDNTGKARIWVFWYQGRESMPDIVKTTFNSILEHSNSHSVILIERSNIDQYIDIPKVIWEKVQSGEITLAAYSDIIRASLLAKYGGLWIDATVLVTKPIPEDVFRRSFFTIKNPENKSDSLFYISVAHLRWTTYVMGGSANNPLFSFLRDELIKYNSREQALIDYLLIDYFMELGYEQFEEIRQEIDDLPFTNLYKEELVHRLGATFPDLGTRQLLDSETYMFKLTYKIQKLQLRNEQTNLDLLNNHCFLESYRNEDS